MSKVYRNAFVRTAKQIPSAIASTGTVTMRNQREGFGRGPLRERRRVRLVWISSHGSIPHRIALIILIFPIVPRVMRHKAPLGLIVEGSLVPPSRM